MASATCSKTGLPTFGDFLDALTRVAGGAAVLDPEVVTQILGASRRVFALETLTARERQVLAALSYLDS